jgi:hypothetical protein
MMYVALKHNRTATLNTSSGKTNHNESALLPDVTILRRPAGSRNWATVEKPVMNLS